MTCREFIEFLLAYVSDELAPDERARFDEHLASCPDCVNYVSSYRTTMDLGTLAFNPNGEIPPEVPAELIQAIMAIRPATPQP